MSFFGAELPSACSGSCTSPCTQHLEGERKDFPFTVTNTDRSGQQPLVRSSCFSNGTKNVSRGDEENTTEFVLLLCFVFTDFTLNVALRSLSMWGSYLRKGECSTLSRLKSGAAHASVAAALLLMQSGSFLSPLCRAGIQLATEAVNMDDRTLHFLGRWGLWKEESL